MSAHRLISRRMLLRDLGKAGFAMMIVGVAACSGDEGGPTTGASGASTTNDPGAPATTGAGSSTTTSQGPTGHEWHRVNLGFVSAYVVYRNGEAVIVDTGVEGSESAIASGLGEVGLDWSDVGGLIVTHRHPDHQGSVPAVLTSASDAPWFAGAGDIGAITAPRAGAVLGDGDSFNDLQVIETPGHTPGHISVLDPASGILLAGDAINGADGGVVGPDPDFTSDMDSANASVVKLASFDFGTVLFGHGEPVLDQASDAVATLADSLGSG